MSQVAILTSGTHEFAIELHRILKELDPARRKEQSRASQADRLAALAGRASVLLETAPAVEEPAAAGLRARLAELRVALESHAERWRGGEGRKQLHRSLQHRYEALAAALRENRIHVPSLRPTNYARNIFHVCWGLFALTLILYVLNSTGLIWASGLFTVYAWTMEISRRASPAMNERIMRLYGKVAHPHEWHRINSATWYASAMLVLALTSPPYVCGVAVAILTFADPSAALVGRRYGRTKLVHGRSLEGSSAFMVMGTLAALGVGLLTGLAPFSALAIALCASFCACLAELFSHRLDDNLTVPLAGMGGVYLGAMILGITL